MLKRALDLLLATAALVATAPLLAMAALGVRLASPGPVLYRAARVGQHGRAFTMYKLRTMHAADGWPGSVVTAADDARVFPLGAWLRRTKIDELPQLVNVIRGEMAIVGPRPEDPRIVTEHYAPPHLATLAVRPGLASPGSVYNFTHGERCIGQSAPEADYLDRVLPQKLALDLVYVRRASTWYDLVVVGRTLRVIAAAAAGRREFPEPPELAEARALVTPARRCAPDPSSTRAAAVPVRPGGLLQARR